MISTPKRFSRLAVGLSMGVCLVTCWNGYLMSRLLLDHHLEATERLTRQHARQQRILLNETEQDRNQSLIRPPVSHPETTSTAGQLEKDRSMSACLLYKDDNEIIEEWLAYHYHTVRLRYLIVAVDPSSETSPLPIFQQWNQLTDLVILVWSDDDFVPQNLVHNNSLVREIPNNQHLDQASATADIETHRFRQRIFLSQCLQHMKSMHRTLTIHIDTDEYIALNPKNRNQDFYGIQTPSLKEPDSILTYMQQLSSNDYLAKKANIPCISLPRLLFGSVETPSSPPTPLDGWNTSRLETMRWKYHSSWTDTTRNAQPKVLVDVSMVPLDDQMFQNDRLFSIHRPSYKLCRNIQQLSFGSNKRYPFIVHHYLGSLQRYLARRDGRRSKEIYDTKAGVNQGPDEWMGPWLDGFVQNVGMVRAKQLLSNYVIP